jgi:hypothetical protein
VDFHLDVVFLRKTGIGTDVIDNFILQRLVIEHGPGGASPIFATGGQS